MQLIRLKTVELLRFITELSSDFSTSLRAKLCAIKTGTGYPSSLTQHTRRFLCCSSSCFIGFIFGICFVIAFSSDMAAISFALESPKFSIQYSSIFNTNIIEQKDKKPGQKPH